MVVHTVKNSKKILCCIVGSGLQKQAHLKECVRIVEIAFSTFLTFCPHQYSPLAVWTFFVQTVKIVKRFCAVSYIVADKNKLISRNVYNDIHILRG